MQNTLLEELFNISPTIYLLEYFRRSTPPFPLTSEHLQITLKEIRRCTKIKKLHYKHTRKKFNWADVLLESPETNLCLLVCFKT